MPQSLLYLILNPLEHYKMDYQEQFFKQLYKQIQEKTTTDPHLFSTIQLHLQSNSTQPRTS